MPPSGVLSRKAEAFDESDEAAEEGELDDDGVPEDATDVAGLADAELGLVADEGTGPEKAD